MSKGQSIAGRKVDYKLNNNDFYETPSWATEIMLENIKFEGNIYEPCSGYGAISRILEGEGYKVISSDLRDDEQVYGKKGVDMLSIEKENVVDNIVTNPPYKFAQEVIEQSLKLANKKVVMLLKLSFLESVSRYEFFQSTPLKNVYVFCKRVTMYPHGTDKPKNSGTVAYAWFEWDNEYKGEPMIKWLNEGIIERDALVEFDSEFNKDDKDEAVKCGNCKENLITDMEIEYSKVTGEYFCSPDCATEYYFEYMESSPVCIDDRYDFKIRDNGVIYDMGKQ